MSDPPGWTSPSHPGWSAEQPPPTPPMPPDPPGAPRIGPGAGPGWGAPPPAWGMAAFKPGVIPLRPLGVGEILDGAISAIRAHPRVMLGLSAVVVVVSQLVQLIATWLLFRDVSAAGVSIGNDATPGEVFTLLADSAGAVVVAVVVTLFAQLVLTGVLTVVVSRAVLGRQMSAGEAWRAARPRLLPLTGVTLVTALLVLSVVVLAAAPAVVVATAGGAAPAVAALGVLGALAALCAGVYVYVSLALAGPACVLERQPVTGALRRSRRLVRGSFWRVFGILLLSAVITTVVGGIFQLPFSLLAAGGSLLTGGADGPAAFGLLPLSITSIGTVLGGVITYPFAAAVGALLYVDQRMRREGLDIELARAAGPPAPGQQPTGLA